MIPYFELPHLSLPLGQKIDIFGVLSAAGVVTGATLAGRQSRKYWPGNDLAMEGAVTWMVMFGLFGGHFLHLFAYHPELLDSRDPWYFLRFWDGLSSMGGVLGALVGIFFYFRKIKTPFLPYVDALAMGAAPGWAIARIGCFLVHDHPGQRTDFFLAVDFPAATFGGPRHDLGLYDCFALAIISAILWAYSTRRPREGRIMGLLAVLYSVQRFSTDFLRASDLSFVDRRYLGLTPAQYIVMGLGLTGVWLLTRKSRELTQLPVPKKGR